LLVARIVGKRTPADTSASETGFVDYAIRTSQPGAAVAPVCRGITMIRDPSTQAEAARSR